MVDRLRLLTARADGTPCLRGAVAAHAYRAKGLPQQLVPPAAGARRNHNGLGADRVQLLDEAQDSRNRRRSTRAGEQLRTFDDGGGDLATSRGTFVGTFQRTGDRFGRDGRVDPGYDFDQWRRHVVRDVAAAAVRASQKIATAYLLLLAALGAGRPRARSTHAAVTSPIASGEGKSAELVPALPTDRCGELLGPGLFQGEQ